MSQTFASWLVLMAGAYLGIGVLFAALFVARGVERIDPRAIGGSWGFRLAILPATAALWPLLAVRWISGAAPPEERNEHRLRATTSAGRERAS